MLSSFLELPGRRDWSLVAEYDDDAGADPTAAGDEDDLQRAAVPSAAAAVPSEALEDHSPVCPAVFCAPCANPLYSEALAPQLTMPQVNVREKDSVGQKRLQQAFLKTWVNLGYTPQNAKLMARSTVKATEPLVNFSGNAIIGDCPRKKRKKTDEAMAAAFWNSL